MILQITAQTDITVTIVQFGVLIVGVASIVLAYFNLISKIKENSKDIENVRINANADKQLFERAFDKFEQSQHDKIEEINTQFEQKFQKLEENSKHFYKQLDAKTDKLETQVNQLLNLMQTMTTDLKVHLAQCDVKHTKK